MFIIGERINGMFKDIAQVSVKRTPLPSITGPRSRKRAAHVTLTSTPDPLPRIR